MGLIMVEHTKERAELLFGGEHAPNSYSAGTPGKCPIFLKIMNPLHIFTHLCT